MTYFHPAWLEHQRKRFTRPDAYRFAAPGTPEAKPPGWLDPSMTRVRWKEAQEREARRQAQAAQEEFERKVLAMKAELASLRTELVWADLRWKAECAERKRRADLAWERFMAAFLRGDFRRKANFKPDQPRDEQGRWTDGGGSPQGDQHDVNLDAEESLAQDRRAFVAPGPGQEPRRDLVDLDAIANHPTIRARIDEAWVASDPNGFGREQGFWISRNETTGELFTRPFANPGGAATIVPGRPPSDAIASFHTHPARADFGGYPGPSLQDVQYAGWIGLPGLLQSHNGMFYFGPPLRPRRSL